PTTQSQAEETHTDMHASTDTTDTMNATDTMGAMGAMDTMTKPQVETVAGEQTTCPVMDGNPIDKNIYVEYKGKKVYFCCKACVEKFKADPEKYVSKLPQFQQ
ncbi:MAG: YHS domain-containing protein, partial [Sedimentisphaerales bacterium]|nr:YHS domain-containing protein [Sedimentisphaerales bacterium]